MSASSRGGSDTTMLLRFYRQRAAFWVPKMGLPGVGLRRHLSQPLYVTRKPRASDGAEASGSRQTHSQDAMSGNPCRGHAGTATLLLVPSLATSSRGPQRGERGLKTGNLCHSSDLSSPVPNSALYSGDIWASLAIQMPRCPPPPRVCSPEGQPSPDD